MMVKSKKNSQTSLPAGLEKCPTGIPGIDQLPRGGLPRGRPTLLCGSAGTSLTRHGTWRK
ncbi:MAG: hypothetical protein COW19_01635 [Zetaproteobacteria bacterium CG12_big_fil_rev_8_21_14_0_65_55_1124]|nr:MAG: hypothetical protein COT53_03170 [Zetaproteobacteria bacterium CG08_land_8_20_14_0_20_55_17]PIW43575.1 MAG: hypothetical protein COW19_01635 [Zetaproteobacteria bacterium CG12_big_fil_rev_8_21_14_0_65_55_1124]PIY52758.1 MAG: hypothetical protein COZ01_06945 [Zetaproteobacteria bacterium CG_4_10_14_0_8_um_filter_55_43]PIZ37942.1 MAG: hypothetical protein COY36_08285 [Zetaproteobacteria bacterium CG_4_10_14_0_2_um_filter_55_20]PJB80546.1 MAG: hypothetical protein CO089_07450 [Zetaproteoba